MTPANYFRRIKFWIYKQPEDLGETEKKYQSILEAGLKEQKVIPVINELGELSKICM